MRNASDYAMIADATWQNRHDALRLALRRLNLGYMSRNFADVALHAAKEGVSHD